MSHLRARTAAKTLRALQLERPAKCPRRPPPHTHQALSADAPADGTRPAVHIISNCTPCALKRTHKNIALELPRHSPHYPYYLPFMELKK